MKFLKEHPFVGAFVMVLCFMTLVISAFALIILGMTWNQYLSGVAIAAAVLSVFFMATAVGLMNWMVEQ